MEENLQNPTNRIRGPRANRGKSPSSLLFVWREAHCEELSSVTGSVGADREVGKWEAWTPQPIMCGTQANIGGVSPRDITDSAIGSKIIELTDQLKV